MRIILIPGYKATAASGFFPWLYEELRGLGHEVLVVNMPNPEAPDRDEWTKALLEQVGAVDDNTVIVGHNLGGAAALRFLEAAEAFTTPHALVLISTPWMIDSERFRGFFMSELDFEVLMWKASKFVVVHSHDDSVIPFDHALKYAKVLHAKLVEVNSAGHFDDAEYPILLETIVEVCNEPVIFAPGEDIADEFTDLAER
jgi:predicted alpha/beta hydrolase family esterase